MLIPITRTHGLRLQLPIILERIVPKSDTPLLDAMIAEQDRRQPKRELFSERYASSVSHKSRSVSRKAKYGTQTKRCAMCRKSVSSRATTCSSKCRSKLSRANKKKAALLAA